MSNEVSSTKTEKVDFNLPALLSTEPRSIELKKYGVFRVAVVGKINTTYLTSAVAREAGLPKYNYEYAYVTEDKKFFTYSFSLGGNTGFSVKLDSIYEIGEPTKYGDQYDFIGFVVD